MAAETQAATKPSNGALVHRGEATAPLAEFNHQNFWPRSWEEGLRYAELLSRAPSMLPKHIKESKDMAAEIFATIMFGFEVGLAPLQALRAIYIVHGRAGIYAADQIALVQKHPECEKLEVATDKQGNPLSDEKSCTWVTKRRGRGEQRETFTMAQAEQEGLTSNAAYKTRPKLMLRWRCATRLLSYTWGDVLRGMEDREAVEQEEKDGGWVQRTTAPVKEEELPPHDPKTGELKEEPVDAETVDELGYGFLVRHIDGATSKEELLVRTTLVQKAKAAKRLTPDEEQKLLELYKAKRASLERAEGAK